jgi:3'-5' exoribonuclease
MATVPKTTVQKTLIGGDAKTTRFSELPLGVQGDCFVLVSSREKSATRDGKPYYRVQFRDEARSATLMVWRDSPWFHDCDTKWAEGAIYKVRVTVGQNQYGLQVDLDRWRELQDGDREQGFDPWQFAPRTRFDVDQLWSELRGLVTRHVVSPPLVDLMNRLLEPRESIIRTHSAAAHAHHAVVGGWLEHVVSMAQTCVFLAEKYAKTYADLTPPLSVELVVAGAILHDIGKLIELDTTPAGTTYTAVGRLIGHILLGRDLVRDAAREIDGFPPEMLLRLEHIIVAHHDLPEFGSPIPPCTLEAMIVHAADNLDAKLEMMAGALRGTAEGDTFSSTDNTLRRRVFRGLPRES